MSRADIIKLVKSSILGNYVNEIEPKLQPAIAINCTREPVGQSRFGGEPCLPSTIEWPQGNQRGLSFLGQIYLSELAKVGIKTSLPKQGVLFFFYDSEEQPWGFDPKDIGDRRVIYFADEVLCGAQQETDGDVEEFGVRYLTFEERCSIPFGDLDEIRNHTELSDDDDEAFCDALDELIDTFAESPNHQLLGHAQTMQGDMRFDCELVANGIYTGDLVDEDDPKIKAHVPNTEDWMLLLQIDSDEDGPGWMWGDTGMLYFMIRKQDLAEKNFDNVMLKLQCC